MEAAQGSTLAGYPTRLVTIDVEGVALPLRIVRRLEDYVEAEALLRDGDAPEPPYWLHLWAGGRVLARAVARRGDWSGRRALELGCGLGLPGLVAARLGARVVLVDAVADALRFARENARLNGCAVDVVHADVLQPAVRGSFDAVLLADVTYDPPLQAALAALIARHLAATGVALVAESVRTRDPGFRRACESLGLSVREDEVEEVDEGRPVRVRLSEVCR